MNLTEIRTIALALPEVTEEPHFHRTSFRVAGKIFATAVAAEPFVNVMAGEAVREPMLAMHPHCMEKLEWGKKIVGLRVDLNRVDADIARELLRQAWADKAPKRLTK
jgi:hypothetical protein